MTKLTSVLFHTLMLKLYTKVQRLINIQCLLSSLQGWINSYESVRFVAINGHTAVITGKYNLEQVKVWLEKYVPTQSLKVS